jgi:hypothetical protein
MTVKRRGHPLWAENDFSSAPPLKVGTAMELRIWRRIYLSPFVRLNFCTKGVTVAFGRQGWFSANIFPASDQVPGAYWTEGRKWKELQK